MVAFRCRTLDHTPPSPSANPTAGFVQPTEGQARSLGRARESRILRLLMLLQAVCLPLIVQAQFIYTIANNSVIVTGYTGPGGEVIIPDEIEGLPVETIGQRAFSGLADVTSVVIPDSVKSIQGCAFDGCTVMESVHLGNHVQTIAAGAFNGCVSLTSVIIPDSVTSIGDEAFSGCTSLSSVSIPSGVTFIGAAAFRDCRRLAKVTIPERLSTIEPFAFQRCSSLIEVEIPDTVNIISESAFASCINLRNLLIGNRVKQIESRAFYDCIWMTNAVIGSRVACIDPLAFGNCPSLAGIYFGGNSPEAGEDINGFSVFDGSDSVTVYYLPGSIGWGPTYADRPTDLWDLPYPIILNPHATRYDFGFTVSWATNAAVVVDFTTDLSNAAWFPVSTNVLDSSFQFSDADWSIHPRRSYRVREIKSFTSVAPIIVHEPESATVEFFQTASFSVTASGTGPFTYQWQHNDVDLVNDGRVSGATNRTLIITEVIWGNAGGYHVVVRNGVGQAISSTAQLSVNEAEPPDFEPSGMVWIPQGTFTMGSPNTEVGRRSNEGPLTQVALTRGFFLGKYEVTQREYLDLVGSNPSYFTGDLDRPVETVSWFDATDYCRLLTQSQAAAGGLPAGWEYRLPTEAQWEYACRAGTTTPFGIGNGTSLNSTQANFDGRNPYGGAAVGPRLGRTTTVGSYAPNAWGLYDMHGNVWEWCLDYPTESLPGGSVSDPFADPTPGSPRVLRGGHWGSSGYSCRSAARDSYPPGVRNYLCGFRVALVQVQ
jgi:formylglycine-generating enzyme required for sulfatase activity